MIGVQPEGADGAAVHVIGGEIDLAWLRDFSRAHEAADFDKVLVGYTSTAAEGFVVAGYAAAHTERLTFLVAHRPGFVAPTLAARKAITLDHLTGGRVAVHIITGGSDVEMRRDGDSARPRHPLPPHRRIPRHRPKDLDQRHPLRLRRRVLPLVTPSPTSKPLQQPGIPLYFGGASGRRSRSGPSTPMSTLPGASRLPRSRAHRRGPGRRRSERTGRRIPRFSVSLRLILGETEEKAWDEGPRLPGADRRPQRRQAHRRIARPSAVGSQRLSTSPPSRTSTTSGSGRRSRPPPARAAIPPPWSAPRKQVAESLLDYYDAGVTTLLIRGFGP